MKLIFNFIFIFLIVIVKLFNVLELMYSDESYVFSNRKNLKKFL